MTFEWKDEAFRELATKIIHDDVAYAKLQEMAAEITRLEAELGKMCDIVEVHDDAVRALTSENERLREALEKIEAIQINDSRRQIAKEALQD